MKPHIPFPKTRVEDYLQYKNEIAGTRNLTAIRYELDNEKGMELKTAENSKLEKIANEFKDKIHSEDIHTFRWINDLEKFLLEDLELKKYKVKETIRHEKKHVKEIYRLGHMVTEYGCILLAYTKNKKTKVTYSAWVGFIGLYDQNGLVTRDDLSKISQTSGEKRSIIDSMYR